MPLLLTAFAGTVMADGRAVWQVNDTGVVRLLMADASEYLLALPDHAEGVSYEPMKYQVGNHHYVAVYQSSLSRPDDSLGYCGAGREVWLKVYRVVGADLAIRTAVLVSSCLHSIALASQNTGSEDQDTDFSSVRWGPEGFFITWDGAREPARYVLDDKPAP